MRNRRGACVYRPRRPSPGRFRASEAVGFTRCFEALSSRDRNAVASIGTAAELERPSEDLAGAEVDNRFRVRPAVLGHPDGRQLEPPQLPRPLDPEGARPFPALRRPSVRFAVASSTIACSTAPAGGRRRGAEQPRRVRVLRLVREQAFAAEALAVSSEVRVAVKDITGSSVATSSSGCSCRRSSGSST